MDAEEFRKHGHEAVEAIVAYMENINDRPVRSQVAPNYLRQSVPKHAPKEPEDFDQVMKDFNSDIMPGITHWHSGKFCAYYPTAFSYPSMLGEMYMAMLGVNASTWAASPAATELEYITMDWVAKLIGLSDAFLNTGKGGGVIQNSASDATLLVMAAARTRILDHLSTQETIDPHVAATKLVAYSSDQTHSSCQKAAKILGLRFRALPTRDDCILRGDVVRQAMREDIAQGLIPCYITVTIGTTSTGAVDDITSIVEACKDTQVWVHVDAAYAGSAMVCPEFRHFMKGVDQVDSFDFNMHKWLLIHFDCSCLFVKDRGLLVRISTGAPDARATTNPTPSTTLSDTPDLRPQSLEVGGTESGESTTTTTRVESLTDFGPSTNRRFRALRLWFTIRSYGQSGLQNFIRNHINLMRYFQTFLAADGRFEVLTPVHFSLIGLRLNPELCQRVDLGMGGVPDKSNPELRNNAANARLHGMINEAGVFLTKSDLHGKTFIRVSIGAFKSNRESVEHIWSVIQQSTDQMLLTPPQ